MISRRQINMTWATHANTHEYSLYFKVKMISFWTIFLHICWNHKQTTKLKYKQREEYRKRERERQWALLLAYLHISGSMHSQNTHTETIPGSCKANRLCTEKQELRCWQRRRCQPLPAGNAAEVCQRCRFICAIKHRHNGSNNNNNNNIQLSHIYM